MARRLPSLNALKAFEAAARHESFTKAAEEALEQELGFRLFQRERQRLVITEAGRSYLEVVRDAFDRLAAGTERLLQRQKAGVLTVSTSPNFAAKWLVHRLGGFAELHPEIDLRVSASMQHVDFARDDVDLAIRHGDGSWPGLHVTRLCVEVLFPVCSPQLANDARRPLRTPADLKKHTLLHLDRRDDWDKWLQAAAVEFTRLRARAGAESGQHGDRCQSGQSGRVTGAHSPRRAGPDRRALGAAVRSRFTGARTPIGSCAQDDRSAAEDRRLPRVVARRGRSRRARGWSG